MATVAAPALYSGRSQGQGQELQTNQVSYVIGLEAVGPMRGKNVVLTSYISKKNVEQSDFVSHASLAQRLRFYFYF